MALCSDAGTPGISDPGFLLVRACVDAGIDVECLPGATAFVPALVTSGLPCDRFYFEGFLPHKKGRQKRLTALLEMPCTVVLYESPHRWQAPQPASRPRSRQPNSGPVPRNLQAPRRNLARDSGRTPRPLGKPRSARGIRCGARRRRLKDHPLHLVDPLDRNHGQALGRFGRLAVAGNEHALHAQP